MVECLAERSLGATFMSPLMSSLRQKVLVATSYAAVLIQKLECFLGNICIEIEMFYIFRNSIDRDLCRI